MDYLIKDEKLELKYEPGKGAWTYHIQIPNTKHIVGKWGYLKVSGSIDGYQLESKNLFTINGQDKLLSVNSEIRKAINKGGGDYVTVTLYLLVPEDQITEKQIFDTFEESGVLCAFQRLSPEEKKEMMGNIYALKTEEKQIKLIVKYINQLTN